MDIPGNRLAPAAMRQEKQPTRRDRARHVVDIGYSGGFRVPVYCGINAPSSPQLVPTRNFSNKADLIRAIDLEYSSWTGNLEFRIESPPRGALGVYDHYRFTTDRDSREDSVAPVYSAVGRKT